MRLIMIVDESGSMSRLRSQTIKSFNDFLAEQKTIKGDLKLTVTIFNSRHSIKIEHIENLDNYYGLNSNNYAPESVTALYDAFCKTVDQAPKDDRTLVCIITDGLENDSHFYSKYDVSQRIKQLEQENWDFVWLGSGFDVETEATETGITHTKRFDNTAKGVEEMYVTFSNSVRSLREKGGDYSI